MLGAASATCDHLPIQCNAVMRLQPIARFGCRMMHAFAWKQLASSGILLRSLCKKRTQRSLEICNFFSAWHCPPGPISEIAAWAHAATHGRASTCRGNSQQISWPWILGCDLQALMASSFVNGFAMPWLKCLIMYVCEKPLHRYINNYCILHITGVTHRRPKVWTCHVESSKTKQIRITGGESRVGVLKDLAVCSHQSQRFKSLVQINQLAASI